MHLKIGPISNNLLVSVIGVNAMLVNASSLVSLLVGNKLIIRNDILKYEAESETENETDIGNKKLGKQLILIIYS